MEPRPDINLWLDVVLTACESERVAIEWVTLADHKVMATMTVCDVHVSVIFDQWRSNWEFTLTPTTSSVEFSLQIAGGIFQAIREFSESHDGPVLFTPLQTELARKYGEYVRHRAEQ